MRSTIIIIVFLLPVFSIGQSMTSQTLKVKTEQISTGVRVENPPSKQQIENLFVLGRIWGFLKYYHPVVAMGIYNFDSCLFSVLPPILKVKNAKKRDELLFHWINTLGDENKFPVAQVNDSNLYSKPDLGWLTDKRLFSEELVTKLDNIYRHRNVDSNYYVRPAAESNPDFSREASYKLV